MELGTLGAYWWEGKRRHWEALEGTGREPWVNWGHWEALGGNWGRTGSTGSALVGRGEEGGSKWEETGRDTMGLLGGRRRGLGSLEGTGRGLGRQWEALVWCKRELGVTGGNWEGLGGRVGKELGGTGRK